jgi:hypothetical protein
VVDQLHEVSEIQQCLRHCPLHQATEKVGVQASCFRALKVGCSCLEGYCSFHRRSSFAGVGHSALAVEARFRWVDIGSLKCQGYRQG